MTEIKRTMIASLLIEQAGEMKHKRPTELSFEDLIDVVQAVVKNCSIPDVGKSLHPELKPVYDFIESMQELKRIGLLEPFLSENREQVAKLKIMLNIS